MLTTPRVNMLICYFHNGTDRVKLNVMPQLLQFQVLVRVGGPQFKYDSFGGPWPEKVENHWIRKWRDLLPSVQCFKYSCYSYYTTFSTIMEMIET